MNLAAVCEKKLGARLRGHDVAGNREVNLGLFLITRSNRRFEGSVVSQSQTHFGQLRSDFVQRGHTEVSNTKQVVRAAVHDFANCRNVESRDALAGSN